MRGMTMLGAVVLVVLGGCDAAEQSPVLEDRVMVGEIDEDTFVAVVTDAERVVAYVCDGTPATVSVVRWFEGSHDGRGFSLTDGQGAGLDGSLAGEALRGRFTLGGAALEYAVFDAEGDAGMFYADAGDLRGGWIVHADGGQRGAVLHRTTGDIVSAQLISTSQASVVLQAAASPLLRLSQPALPQ